MDAQNVFIPQTGTYAIIDDLYLGSNPVTAIKNNAIGSEIIRSIYPLPATNTAYMIYSLNETSLCELALYDFTGKLVKTIFNEDKQTEGNYKAEIPVYDLPAGVYFAQLKVNGEISTSKFVKQ